MSSPDISVNQDVPRCVRHFNSWSHMKILAIVVSGFVLLGYVFLMRIDSTWGLLYPRGGIVMLAISLTIANAAICLSGQTDRDLNTRFQFAAAGWIWLFVQGGCIAYIYAQVDAA